MRIPRDDGPNAASKAAKGIDAVGSSSRVIYLSSYALPTIFKVLNVNCDRRFKQSFCSHLVEDWYEKGCLRILCLRSFKISGGGGGEMIGGVSISMR